MKSGHHIRAACMPVTRNQPMLPHCRSLSTTIILSRQNSVIGIVIVSKVPMFFNEYCFDFFWACFDEPIYSQFKKGCPLQTLNSKP